MLAIGNVETDEDDRPVDPIPKITKTEVIVNPYPDIVASKPLPKAQPENKPDKDKPAESKKKLRVVKNNKLISFADDEDDEDDEDVKPKTKRKIKSSHDVLNDPKLAKVAAVDEQKLEEQRRKREQKEAEKLKAEEENLKETAVKQERAKEIRERISTKLAAKTGDKDSDESDSGINNVLKQFHK